MIQKYGKSIAVFVIGLVAFVASLLTAGHWTTQDTVALLGWLASTLGAYAAPAITTTKPPTPPPNTPTP